MAPPRKPDAPSPAAQRIEEELIDKTGAAAGDTDRSPQEKFADMGEKPEIKKRAGRD